MVFIGFVIGSDYCVWIIRHIMRTPYPRAPKLFYVYIATKIDQEVEKHPVDTEYRTYFLLLLQIYAKSPLGTGSMHGKR